MVPALISSGQGHSQEIHDQQQSLEGLTALETGQMAFGRRSLSEAKEKVGVELWLQPPSKCFSQQRVSLRNFRKNMSIWPVHLQSAAPTHPAQAQPNTSKIYQHCNL